MSLFRRENTPGAPAAGPSAPEAPAGAASKRRLTHVAPGTKVKGEISGATELLVDGEVEGEVRVQAAVTVGADGTVTGPITAPSVRVGGRVVGDVAAHDRVEVTASGSLEGNISAPRIVIGEGAFFRGKVEMKGMEAKPEPSRFKAPGDKPGGDRPLGKANAAKNETG
jgi:cytoskeletal protein CcmA (bactofilin family)